MIFMAVLLAVAILILLFVVLFRLLARRPQQTASVEWLDNFSLESYAPMGRLLNQSDIAFLASQPGYRPEMGRRMMAERRKIFRDYLRLLIRDFNQLMSLGKLMVVHGAEDRAELAKSLWRHEIAFYFAVALVQCKLALWPLGLPAMDVHKLIEPLEAMRDQVQLLAARRMAAVELS